MVNLHFKVVLDVVDGMLGWIVELKPVSSVLNRRLKHLPSSLGDEALVAINVAYAHFDSVHIWLG
jgi:hypothetical protein